MKLLLKKLFSAAGGILTACSILFVILKIKSYAHQLDFSIIDYKSWSTIVICIVIYGLANFFLSFAWLNILHFYKIFTLHSRQAIKIYGISQLAKYIPGNIMHFASRQAYGMAAGMPATPLAKSALWELGLIAVVGALFIILATPLFFPALTQLCALTLWAVVCLLGYVLTNQFVSGYLARAFFQQLCFLAISGIVFVAILLALKTTSTPLSSLISMGGAYVVAWLIGLITPGSPAGIGIREAFLLFLLNEKVVQEDLLVVVLVGRIITVGGDILFFLITKFLPEKKTKKGHHEKPTCQDCHV